MIATTKATWWENTKEQFFSEQSVTTRRKFYNTIWTLIFSFIIISTIFLISGNNPFKVITNIFEEGIGKTYGNVMVTKFAAYVFAALGVAICFKAGLFNIGISGQMMAAGFTTLLIFRSELLTQEAISSGSIVLAFFIAIIVGAFLSLVSGLLKSFLGINEVVSTIMLNWVIFFIIKALVHEFETWNGMEFLADNTSISTDLSLGYPMPSFFQPTNGSLWYSNNWNWVIIFLAIVFVVATWFIISKTSFGYKIKMVGLNKDAAEYSGTNQKSLTLITFIISGALAGVAGFIWYVGSGGEISIGNQPLNAGFDAISISLLVFNNPVGVLFSGLFYGIVSAGVTATPQNFNGIPAEIDQVIIGILVYGAAITFIFTKFNMLNWCKNFFIYNRNRFYPGERVRYWTRRIELFFKRFNVYKEIFNIWVREHKNWSVIKEENKTKIKNLENEIRVNNTLKVFDVTKIKDQDQLNYFNKLAQLKRETDAQLAERGYFEKNMIKAKRIEAINKAKTRMNKVKEFYKEEWKIARQKINEVNKIEDTHERKKQLSHVKKEIRERRKNAKL